MIMEQKFTNIHLIKKEIKMKYKIHLTVVNSKQSIID